MSGQVVVIVVVSRLLFLAAAVGVVSGGFISTTDSCSLRPVVVILSRHHNTPPPLPPHHTRARGRRRAATALFHSAKNNNDDNEVNATTATAEAERLLARAKAIREELGNNDSNKHLVEGKGIRSPPIQNIQSEFSLPSTSLLFGSNNNYRLYLDVGREPGTWMDPRWGASGRRIECTIDVSFFSSSSSSSSSLQGASPDEGLLSSEEITSGLIKTVATKSSSSSSKLSPVFKLHHAPFARLRSGFDKMKINDGGYCIEYAPKSSTIRFCLSVSGTGGSSSSSASYGDVFIPEGKLYFALPYFGTTTVQSEDDDSNNIMPPSMSISKKEGTICVKQFGWNTGWWREESRILGVFRAVPLDEAKRRDKF
jgi:hypothetical protein